MSGFSKRMRIVRPFHLRKKLPHPLAFAAGIFFLAFAFPSEGVPIVAPLGDGVRQPTFYSPCIEEEIAHETALREAEKSARRKRLPGIKTHWQETYVRSTSDGGFLDVARAEIQVFEKTKPTLEAEMASLDLQMYQVGRRKFASERAREFRSLTAEAGALRRILPKLAEKQKLLAKLSESETRLVAERIKPINDLENFYREELLFDQAAENARSKLKTLEEKLSSLANGKIELSKDPEPAKPHLFEGGFEKAEQFCLMRHPDVRKLELEIEKASARVKIEKRKWLPEVVALSTYTHDPRFSGSENQIFAGVEVRWDVWDWGAGRPEISKEEFFARELEVKLANEKKELTLEMEEAFRSFQAARFIYSRYQSFLEFEKKADKSWFRKLRMGEISSRERLRAKLRLLDAEIALEKAKEDVLKKEAGLFFALGLAEPSEVVLT